MPRPKNEMTDKQINDLVRLELRSNLEALIEARARRAFNTQRPHAETMRQAIEQEVAGLTQILWNLMEDQDVRDRLAPKREAAIHKFLFGEEQRQDAAYEQSMREFAGKKP